MKWSIIGLLTLGVVAAVSAAVLVTSLMANTQAVNTPAEAEAEGPAPEVQILVAAHDMDAMAVVGVGSVVKKTAQRETAPPGYYSEVAQVAGHVLLVPIVEGQCLTPECFVTKGSGRDLAAVLRLGMRAVSIALRGDAALDGILYPGSIVDVVVSLSLPSAKGEKKEAVSTTVLKGIQVLGVEERTVVTPREPAESYEIKRRHDRTSTQMITLVVTPRQAEMLRLAVTHGQVSLALRNPLDEARVDATGVWLNELSPEYLERLRALEEAATAGAAPGGAPAEDAPTATARKPAKWDVLILRGGARETRSIDIPDALALRMAASGALAPEDDP